MAKPKFIIAAEKKTVMHRGVLPVKVIELYLESDKEIKPSNKLKKVIRVSSN